MLLLVNLATLWGSQGWCPDRKFNFLFLPGTLTQRQCYFTLQTGSFTFDNSFLFQALSLTFLANSSIHTRQARKIRKQVFEFVNPSTFISNLSRQKAFCTQPQRARKSSRKKALRRRWWKPHKGHVDTSTDVAEFHAHRRSHFFFLSVLKEENPVRPA